MLRNYTPHELVIYDDRQRLFQIIESSGNARVTSKSVSMGHIDGIPVIQTIFGEVTGLPSEEDGMFYIVSQFVIAALPMRNDLLRPDTGPTCVRDDDGKILGVRALTR